jgi:hypothetical protein
MTTEPTNDLDAIQRRWSTDGGMGNDRSADDYTDAGCRVLAEAAFRDVPSLVAELRQARADAERLSDALGVAMAEKAAIIAEICSTTWEYMRSVDGREMRRRAAGPWEDVNG